MLKKRLLYVKNGASRFGFGGRARRGAAVNSTGTPCESPNANMRMELADVSFIASVRPCQLGARCSITCGGGGAGLRCGGRYELHLLLYPLQARTDRVRHALCSCGRMAPCGGIGKGGGRLEHWQSTPRPDVPCPVLGNNESALGWPDPTSPRDDSLLQSKMAPPCQPSATRARSRGANVHLTHAPAAALSARRSTPKGVRRRMTACGSWQARWPRCSAGGQARMCGPRSCATAPLTLVRLSPPPPSQPSPLPPLRPPPRLRRRRWL